MSGQRRLYLGHIPGSAQRADIEDFFKPFGRINDIRLMAGFGFIEFDDSRDAEDAVRDLNGKDFMGDRLLVEFAKSPRSYDGPPRDRPERGPMRFGPRGSGHRLTVRNLPDGTSWQDLKDFARSAGQVSYADVDRNNPSEGTIEYPNKDDFDVAMKTLDGGQINGATVKVSDANGGYASSSRRDDDRAPDRSADRGSYRRDDYDSRGSADRGSYSRRDDYRRSPRGDDRRDDRRRDDRRRSRSRSPAPRSASGRDSGRDRDRSPAPRSSRDDRY